MQVQKCQIPSQSLAAIYLPADYSDAFTIRSDEALLVTPDDLIISFFTDMPGWVSALFTLRNFLVKFVGLQGSKDGQPGVFADSVRNGTSYRFVEFPVKDEHETVVLMKDKHLDAYLSVRIENKSSVYLNTLVKYNNALGKVYFFFIRPFHGLIVRSMLKRVVERARG